MTASRPLLPQELIDHIIDHLHDDRPSLYSCSLVCRAWVQSSRVHLFSKVVLRPGWSRPRSNSTIAPASAGGPDAGGRHSPSSGELSPNELCRRLHAVLKSNPDIVSCVRAVEICEGTMGMPNGSRSTSWITTERTLSPLLKLLTHVRRLSIGAQSVHLYWSTLPPNFQDAMRHVLSLPSLSYLKLYYWSFQYIGDFADLLDRCQNLKGLQLSSVMIGGGRGVFGMATGTGQTPVPSVDMTASTTSEPSPDSDSTSTSAIDREPETSRKSSLEFLTLDYLDIGYFDPWLLNPRSGILLDSLRELRVAKLDNFTSVKKILAATGNSLRHVHLKPETWNVASFDLSLNSHLRSIRLTLDEPQHALRCATTVLSTLLAAHTNNLEVLGLEFYTDLKRIRSDGWTALSSLLLRPEFAHLAQVEVGLFALPSRPEFVRVREELAPLESRRGVALRVYQLGVKGQKSNVRLTPLISRYEYSS